MATAVRSKRVDIVSVKLVKESSVKYPKRFITNPQDAAHLAHDVVANSDREKVVVLCLDSKNQPTSISTISVGTLNSSFAHPREVLKAVILSNSAGFLMIHNHPSGDLTPSKDDINTTKRLQEAGDLMGIELLDSIIVSGDRYLSFREQGLM